jgi:hypothetical protein
MQKLSSEDFLKRARDFWCEDDIAKASSRAEFRSGRWVRPQSMTCLVKSLNLSELRIPGYQPFVAPAPKGCAAAAGFSRHPRTTNHARVLKILRMTGVLRVTSWQVENLDTRAAQPMNALSAACARIPVAPATRNCARVQLKYASF